MSTGERLKSLREKRDLSASELAEQFGCTRQYIHSLEREKNRISRSMLDKYCRFFKTSANFIMGMDEENPTIPVFNIADTELDEEASISIPPSFLKSEKEYFAITIGNTRLVILEKDKKLCYEKPGFFKYRGRYYFSKIRRFSDGSVWLISDSKRQPEKIEEIGELTALGYQSYQLA